MKGPAAMTTPAVLRYMSTDTTILSLQPKGARMTLPTYPILTTGEWHSEASGETFETQNPYTGKAWAKIPRCAEADVHKAVAAAKAAFDKGPWPAMTATQRGALLRRLGDLIAENA